MLKPSRITNRIPSRISCSWSIFGLLRGSCFFLFPLLATADDVTAKMATSERVPWVASRFHGSPDTPLPLSVEAVFPQLYFNDPVHVRWQEELGRYFVCEQQGKIWSFPHDATAKSADLVVDLKPSLRSFDPERFVGFDSLYTLVFDPEFAHNRFVYLCIIFRTKDGKPSPDGNRISRFCITEQSPPTIDVASELPIIHWQSNGHSGCDLAFDHSGCLLISTGDAGFPSPPDALQTGQDINDLLASILRIDVRDATVAEPYRIPEDNPFRHHSGARPEVWAYGFRNPWRIAVDSLSGQLWLGDVGWEKWELVHQVNRGGNYGWSVREGEELIQPQAPLGPTPILPPRVVLSHADSASITGGYVYRGRAIPEIAGHYLFGDWVNGRLWSVPIDTEAAPGAQAHREIASAQLRIVAIAPDREGEPIIVNHVGKSTLYRLVPNAAYAEQLAASQAFPRLLSQTGLFADTEKATPSPGVRAFTINQPQWQDGARSDYWLALPQQTTVTVYNDPQPIGSIAMFKSRLHYPEGTVLAKTLQLPVRTVADQFTEHRVETQVLHFDGRLWRGYSYLWNDSQDDAELAPASGMDLNLHDIALPHEPSQGRELRWRVPSRSECLQCHNPWPETTLAFTPEQLFSERSADASPWMTLVREGHLVTRDKEQREVDPRSCVRRPLCASEDESLETRARSYLHANCAHCHQLGAGAAVDLSLKMSDDPRGMKTFDLAPSKGSFGIEAAKIIASGDAASSVLLYRVASCSTGRMPHIGSREVDFAGVALLAAWINSLTAEVSSTPAALASDASSGGDDSSARLPASVREALSLAIVCAKHRSDPSPANAAAPISNEQASALARSSDPCISALFEAFLPATERQRRLATNASFAEVADLHGDAVAGEAYFFDSARSQCSKCHRVGTRGSQLGPDLTQVGKASSATQLFESLLDPSRVIAPQYQSHTMLLLSGEVVTGLIKEETAESLTLLSPQGTVQTIKISELEARNPAPQSLMPSGLTNALTAQQIADLLAYLQTLK